MTLIYKIEKGGVTSHLFGEFDFASSTPDLSGFFHEKVYRQAPAFPLSERHLAQYDSGSLTLQLKKIRDKLDPGVTYPIFLEWAGECFKLYIAELVSRLGPCAEAINFPKFTYLFYEAVPLGDVKVKCLRPVEVEALLAADMKMLVAARNAYEAGDLNGFVKAFEGEKLYLNPFALEDEIISKLTAAKITEVEEGFFVVNAFGLPMILSDLKTLGYSITKL